MKPVAEAGSVLKKLMFFQVRPLVAVLYVTGDELFEMVTKFEEYDSASRDSPTMVTAAVAWITTLSMYVPAFIVTVGIPELCAKAIAGPTAVNCPLPSVATVTMDKAAI